MTGQGPTSTATGPRGQRATGQGSARQSQQHLELPCPEDATNAQFMAALDARLASNSAAAPQASADDALYARVTGQTSAPAPSPVNMSDDALWGRLFTKPAA